MLDQTPDIVVLLSNDCECAIQESFDQESFELNSLILWIAHFNAYRKTLSSYYRNSCYSCNTESCYGETAIKTRIVERAILAVLNYGEKIALISSESLKLSKNQRKWIYNYCLIHRKNVPWWL